MNSFMSKLNRITKQKEKKIKKAEKYRGEAREIAEKLIYGYGYFYYDDYIYVQDDKSYVAEMFGKSERFYRAYNIAENIDSKEKIEVFISKVSKTLTSDLPNYSMDEVKDILEKNPKLFKEDTYDYLEINNEGNVIYSTGYCSYHSCRVVSKTNEKLNIKIYNTLAKNKKENRDEQDKICNYI